MFRFAFALIAAVAFLGVHPDRVLAQQLARDFADNQGWQV